MIPLPPPSHGIDEHEVVRQLALLDPCSAWRADLADAGLAEPLPEPLAEQWLLWLQIATVFDRLRSLPVSERAAYARSTGPVWQTAERVTGEGRFRQVAEVMAGWEGAAPALEGFRELLWAVEQGEAEGALRVTYNALFSLASSVPDADLRAGHVAAQAGRVLRTLGLLGQAVRAFEDAQDQAQGPDAEWLRVRVKLGMGVIQQARGNYPVAREIFGAALADAHPFADLLVGAHLGLMSAAHATEEFGLALEHAWSAFQYAQGDRRSEVEALTILASLSIKVGEFGAALASCRLALTKGANRQLRWDLLRYVVQASVGLEDRENVLAYLPGLIAELEHTPDPWQEAQGRRVAGEALAYLGDPELASRYLEQSMAVAAHGGYAELRYRADEALSRLSRRPATPTARPRQAGLRGPVALSNASQAVIDQLSCLAVA